MEDIIRVKFNIYAPDVEDTIFGGQGNAPEDGERLRRQIIHIAPAVVIISMTPAFHGTFDVELEGSDDDLCVLATELGVEDWGGE